jgi:uncharacterized protein (DUF305 family)
MALRFWIFPAALLSFNMAAVGQQARTSPESAPIVQPGAPGENSKMLSPATAAIVPREPSEADTRFMQGMILHHAQAVEMTALLRTRGRDKAIQRLGERISISQTDEIKFMRQWLEERGKAVPTEHDQMAHMAHMNHQGMDMGAMAMMPGMLSPEQMKALARASGPKFDHLFLTGMIQHHTGALIMVQELFDTAGAGQDNQLYDFATDVDNTQTAEINVMKGMLLKEKK